MQYPIIDLLASVSGEIVTGKNLLNATGTFENCTLNNDGSYTLDSLPSINKSFVIGNITLNGGNSYILSGGYNDDFRIYIPYDGTNYVSSMTESASINVSENTTVTVYAVVTTSATIGSKIYPMVRLSAQSSGFEPYFSVTFPQLSVDDIVHRLKLPMLKYFPSAVYHALKALDNGETLSYEQYQVLEHYLLPLNLVQV